MRRPLTKEERRALLANPELVMFVPQHRGITPVTFLLVVPVITGVTLVGLFLAFGLFSDFVEAAPVASSLTFIAVCVISSFVFMFLKGWYDQAHRRSRCSPNRISTAWMWPRWDENGNREVLYRERDSM